MAGDRRPALDTGFPANFQNLILRGLDDKAIDRDFGRLSLMVQSVIWATCSSQMRYGRMTLDRRAIIIELEVQRDCIDTAIAALSAFGKFKIRKRRRWLSAAARKQISDSMKKTWALRKKKGIS